MHQCKLDTTILLNLHPLRVRIHHRDNTHTVHVVCYTLCTDSDISGILVMGFGGYAPPLMPKRLQPSRGVVFRRSMTWRNAMGEQAAVVTGFGMVSRTKRASILAFNAE